MEPVKLVYTTAGLGETDWISFIFNRTECKFRQIDQLERAEPNTIYAISSNKTPLDKISMFFYRTIKRHDGVGLLHLSDEWLDEDYNYYKYFSFVLRTYHTRRLEREGILQIPLGYSNNTSIDAAILPASERAYTWSFSGNNLKASRPEMINSLSSVCPPPATTPEGHLHMTKTEYNNMLMNTVFCPCPMGSVMIDTWRLYEALEFGCIPMVERRVSIDYYRNLFGDHPIPAFSSWKSAASYMASAMRDPQSNDLIQKTIFDWWQNKKSEVCEIVADFVHNGITGKYEESLSSFSFPTGLSRRIWQYGELLRHHSLQAIRRRLAIHLRRGTFSSVRASADKRKC
jgi:hypothetical protein